MEGDEDLPCKALVERVTDYLDGSLTAAERRRMEDHATRCRDCAIHLNQMRRTVAAIVSSQARSPGGALSDAAQERLVAAFRAHAGAARRKPR